MWNRHLTFIINTPLTSQPVTSSFLLYQQAKLTLNHASSSSTQKLIMKSPKSSSSKKHSNKTPKITQPKPLKVFHPSPLIAAPPSTSQEQSGTPSASKMHVNSKRPIDTTVDKSLSKSAKRAKNADPKSAEEVSKELTVGFGLDKHWYETTLFPQLLAVGLLRF